MPSRVLAIDGPAGSGKSTTAAAVAEQLDLPHVESGALYRAITLAGLDAGVELGGQRLVALARSLPIRLDLTDAGFRPEIAGVDVSQEIRSARVTARVSEVSAMAEVREWVNEEVREAVARHPRGAVLDGRDIGTVVFPDAVLKIFLVADPVIRARRRLLQDGRVPDPDAVASEVEALERRDAYDSTREVAPLRRASDAVVLDTTDLSFEQQVRVIVDRARNLFP
ncbi:MAG: (d)CMP kinase [Gemmatimonadota bacterium]|nr:MAG: (d)CMP kinase [Gemmatimonadota bacterium]